MSQEEFLKRLELLMGTAEKLALHLNAQTDDAMDLIFQLQEERRRFAIIADALSRKLFEKAITQMIDEERESQARAKSKRSGGGFDLKNGKQGLKAS